jgi:hypothetical protein
MFEGINQITILFSNNFISQQVKWVVQKNEMELFSNKILFLEVAHSGKKKLTQLYPLY